MKFLFCLLVVFSFGVHSAETKDFESAGIKKLEVSSPKGEIVITTVKGSKKFVVTVDKIQFDKKCKLTMESSMGTLKVVIDHENALFDKANCVGKIKIDAPLMAFDSDVSTGSASLKMTGVEGKIDFKTATGSVDITGDVLHTVEGKTATGNMRLAYNNCSGRADIDLVTASGDAEIYLPTQCKIRVTHKSATGDLFNELGESENYQVLINAKSATGNLKVKKIGK
jgi:DUF4097 and DUF4098 domain-containing protein YvlB